MGKTITPSITNDQILTIATKDKYLDRNIVISVPKTTVPSSSPRTASGITLPSSNVLSVGSLSNSKYPISYNDSSNNATVSYSDNSSSTSLSVSNKAVGYLPAGGVSLSQAASTGSVGITGTYVTLSESSSVTEGTLRNTLSFNGSVSTPVKYNTTAGYVPSASNQGSFSVSFAPSKTYYIKDVTLQNNSVFMIKDGNGITWTWKRDSSGNVYLA